MEKLVALAARKRFEKLKKSKRVQKETLFVEKIDELDIEGLFSATGVWLKPDESFVS